MVFFTLLIPVAVLAGGAQGGGGLGQDVGRGGDHSSAASRAA